MAGGRLQKNKAHKTKFASKSSRREHKLGSVGGDKVAPGKNNAKHVLNKQTAKELRMLRSKNIRDHKRAVLLSEKRAIKGDTYPPRIVALIPLSSHVQAEQFKDHILRTGSAEEIDGMETDDTKSGQFSIVGVSRHKLRLMVVVSPQYDVQTCLQVAKVADVVVFVGDAEHGTDKSGSVYLSMLRAQGLPNVMGVILGLSQVALKKRSDVKKAAFTRLEADLPSGSKLFCGDETSDCEQILRHIADQRPSHVQWRSQRPFVLAEQLDFEPDVSSPTSGSLIISGYVREQNLSVNQLVHVSGVGDFQLQSIDIVDDPCPLRGKTKCDAMTEDTEKKLYPNNSQEELIVTNVPDTLLAEQTWPTEEELAQADTEFRQKKKKKIPKGTSAYQAAWIVDESDNEDNNDSGEEEEAQDKNATEDAAMDVSDEEASALSEEEEDVGASSAWGEDADTTDMMDEDELTAAQTTEELRKLKGAAHDEEFPDEVDTPLDVEARKRFAKYRGMKSFRTSPWDPKESLPQEYGRIFAFDNFNRTFKHVLENAKKAESATLAHVGSYVKLRVKDFPSKNAAEIVQTYKITPVVVCGLLQHESKMCVLHFSIKKHDSFTEPVKSKEPLIFHTGFRSYTTRPIFSTDDLNMNKHKYERFLHPGRFSVASVYSSIHFPPSPLVVFKNNGENVDFVAAGSLRGADPDRIILKRIILSGFPARVHKKKAVVRFMFHNPEDVQWFKPLELWTKYGRRGRIMAPVGTHGSMKCIFDNVVQQRDAVCLSLYKRVFPKWPECIMS